MNHNYPSIPSVLQPTSTPFTMCNPVPLNGTPLYHREMFGQPPPSFPMHYAYYPGSSFLPHVSSIRLSTHFGLQPTAFIQQHVTQAEC